MRRIAIPVAVLIVLLAAGPASAQVRLGLKLTGGAAYLGGGDLNKGLQGWNELWEWAYEVPWIWQTGGYEPVHFGPGFGAEVLLKIGYRWQIGLGVERLQASKSSALSLIQETRTDIESWSPKIAATPVSLNVYYLLPGDKASVGFRLGAAYYRPRYTDSQHLFIFGDDLDETFDLSGAGIGLQGGMGIEVPLTRALSFLVDLGFRYAPIGGFEGSVTARDSTGASATTNGKLWLCETADYPYFPFLSVAATQPGGAGVKNVREAKVDFSGASLSAGVIIRL